jgi:hypothetical protein
MAPRDIRPGKNYDEEVLAGIESCVAIVVLLSDGANASEHVKREIELAISENKELIPVRIQGVAVGCKLKYFLAGRQILNAYGASRETGISCLLHELKRMTESLT